MISCRLQKILLVTLALSLLFFHIEGQDLGSSTDLLKTTRKKSSSRKKAGTTAKKPANTRNRSRRPNPRSRKTETAQKAETSPNTKTNAIEKEPVVQERLVNIRPSTVLAANNAMSNSDAVEEKYENAIESGNTERNDRNYTAAENSYLRAQSLKSNDSRAIYGLGNLYSDQGRWEEAENAYRSAIKIDPNSPEAFVALSFVLTQPIAGMNLIERYVEAEKLARRAIEIDSENAVAFDQLGVSLELQGNISDETQTFYQKAVKLDSTFALAHAHLGRLLRKKGLIDDSANAYVNAIQYSVDVPTMILVADVMQSQQRYLDSEQLLRRALRSDPKNPTALYLLGRALTTRGNYEEAEAVLKKSAEVSPKSFVSYTLLGSLFLRRGKFETAESYLEQAKKVVSPNEQRRLAYDFEAVGDGYLSDGKMLDAARVYQKALLLDENRADLAVKFRKTQPNQMVK